MAIGFGRQDLRITTPICTRASGACSGSTPSRSLGGQAVAICRELGLPLKVLEKAAGGAADAAFAFVRARGH